MTDRTKDRSLIAILVGVLVTATLFFIGYSYKTSDKMDRSAVSAGSSTSPASPNTLQDKANDKPGGTQTTGTNVPRATRD